MSSIRDIWRLELIGLLLIVLIADPAAVADKPGTTLLRGKVVDADTKAIIPCRISIQADTGAWYFPASVALEGSAVIYNKHSLFDPGIVEMHATLSAHPFQVPLPPGRYTIRVERGKEYHEAVQVVDVGREPLDITILLRRWIDMAGSGWYSGETHTHRPLGELPNIMLAEDLNVTFPLVDWVRDAFVPPLARRRSGQPDLGSEPLKVDATHWIYPRNTEYELFNISGKSHTLGAFFVINHKTPSDLGAPPVRPVAERAHREGALIELDKHSWPWSMAIVPIMPVDLFELSNNHVWQTAFGITRYGELPPVFMNVPYGEQGFTERGWIEFGFQNYYVLLDCGFRLRPTAGTASGVHPVPLGFGRVYVHLGENLPFDGSAWLQGLNRGRSFVTTGPMLVATLDGHDPGAAPFQGPHCLRARAVSARPLKPIEIVVNGEVVRAIPAANRKTDRGAYETLIDEVLTLDGSSWIAIRCFEDRPDGRVRFAHTGPFHVEVPGKPLRPRKAEVQYLVQRVEDQIARSTSVLPAAAIVEYRDALRIYQNLLPTAR